MRSGDAGPSVVVTWAVCSRGGARGSLSLSLLRRALHPSPSSPSGQGGPRRRRCAMPLVRYRKVVILGYRSVGKTSLAHQFIDGEFLDCYDPTVESTYNKMLMVGKDEFHLQLVDTAGQDEYTILPHSFTIGIHGYVLVYSVTSLKSFQVVKSLHSKLYESRGKTRMPVVLVGNKADLSLESRQVKTDEGRKLADSWGAVFLESSAKENQLTQGIFTKVIEEIDRVDNSCGEHRSCILM
ncbi:GTPase RhebL1 [Sceloporus undulatus]|uniref:GTPase RhebL1 n=1 Tax=Sceloporus undulatus TaxID=8520 RepID=UPI001C4D0AA5|nr:GTPase RhebL1 [Sceloporus undulatus]